MPLRMALATSTTSPKAPLPQAGGIRHHSWPQLMGSTAVELGATAVQREGDGEEELLHHQLLFGLAAPMVSC